MISLWDLYHDATDAAVVLDAIVLLERRGAVREPLPIDDVDELARRLQSAARLSSEDAGRWRREAKRRTADAAADGAGWRSAEVARRMAATAAEVSDRYRAVAVAADEAVADIEGRLEDIEHDELQRAERQAEEHAEEQLRKLDGET
jgi:hypothetical protein